MASASQAVNGGGNVVPTNPLAGYLTQREFARKIHRTVPTVKEWHRLGTAPRKTRIGGRIYYSPRAIQEWLDSRTE